MKKLGTMGALVALAAAAYPGGRGDGRNLVSDGLVEGPVDITTVPPRHNSRPALGGRPAVDG